MANYLINDTQLTNVANAIRAKSGSSNGLAFPDGFITAIQAVPTGVGGTIKKGVIRPDATLIQRWTYDNLLVADLGIAIPNYSTSSVTLVDSSSLGSVTIPSNELNTKNIFMCYRTLCYPISSSSAPGFKYHTRFGINDFIQINKEMIVPDTQGTIGNKTTFITSSSTRIVYYDSSVHLWKCDSANYGWYASSPPDPTITTNNNDLTISFSSPSFQTRGNLTYYKENEHNLITDVRLQYIVEVYTAPHNGENIPGFFGSSQFYAVNDDFYNNNGTLR